TSDALAHAARALRQAEPAARQALENVVRILELDPVALDAINVEQADLQNVANRLETIAEAVDRYSEWTQISHLRNRMGALGSGALAGRMDAGDLDGPRAVIELRFARAELLWREALSASSALHEIA